MYTRLSEKKNGIFVPYSYRSFQLLACIPGPVYPCFSTHLTLFCMHSHYTTQQREGCIHNKLCKHSSQQEISKVLFR